MVKVITVLIVALAVASGAAAQTLTQGQNWNIGLGSQVDISGAAGSANNLQGLTTFNTQSLGSGLGTVGTQSFTSALLQSASINEDQEKTAELLAQASPLVQTMDGLGTGGTFDLGGLSSMGSLSAPYGGSSASLGTLTAGIPWDTSQTGGLGKPW
jgi:hypothetical protein